MQARILSEAQIGDMLRLVKRGKTPERDAVIILLSTRAGLRSREIGAVTWAMVSRPDGELDDVLTLPNSASKGKHGGRIIPLHPTLLDALVELRERQASDAPGDLLLHFSKSSVDPFVRAETIQKLFYQWFRRACMKGASSHSGRRTFITTLARRAHEAGGTLRDVQALAGHRHLITTQRYIETDPAAQKRMVALVA